MPRETGVVLAASVSLSVCFYARKIKQWEIGVKINVGMRRYSDSILMTLVLNFDPES